MILITSINKRRENEEKRTLKEESHSSPAGRPGVATKSEEARVLKTGAQG
jgi:hypothetical protein